MYGMFLLNYVFISYNIYIILQTDLKPKIIRTGKCITNKTDNAMPFSAVNKEVCCGVWDAVIQH